MFPSLSEIMDDTITITSDHPSFHLNLKFLQLQSLAIIRYHLYQKLFHKMSNQTITITGNHPSFHLYLKLFHMISNQTNQTITGNHPSFHLYLKLFHMMSNQTKTTKDASVTQWELGTKTSIFTMIHTESQSLLIIISPLLFKCFEE